jgi:TPR repeat protein
VHKRTFITAACAASLCATPVAVAAQAGEVQAAVAGAPLAAQSSTAGGPTELLALAVSSFETGRYALAAERFGRLAEMGSAVAETMLGVMHSRGLGVPADQASAVAYFYRAASRGYGPAQLALADAIARGDGTVRDSRSAYLWSRLAEQNGDARTSASAGRLSARLGTLLTSGQRAAIEDDVRSWRPRAALSR